MSSRATQELRLQFLFDQRFILQSLMPSRIRGRRPFSVGTCFAPFSVHQGPNAHVSDLKFQIENELHDQQLENNF
jgi:hypothetical protein